MNAKRLSDHLFNVKIEVKQKKTKPQLSEILDFLDIAFKHILSYLKKFYRPEDNNIAFMSLFQSPMTNALSTVMILIIYFAIELFRPN